MVNVLFASNSTSHFPGTTPSSESWAFDDARVPYAIETPTNTVCSSPLHTATSSNETWYHFRHGQDTWNANRNETICEIVDVNGLQIFKMYFRSQTGGYNMTFTVDGISQNQTRNLPMADDQARTYDVRIYLLGFSAICDVYVNEILLHSFSIAVTTFELPRFLWLGGSEDTGRYSEILIADASTINARLDLVRPLAQGVHSDWDGLLTALSDDDPTTGMTTTLANQVQSTTMEPYAGADNISNIVQVTSTVRGVNSPANLQHMVRLSAVDYFTANIPLDFAKEYQVTDWTQNPATSLPWQKSELTGIEFGFKSIT